MCANWFLVSVQSSIASPTNAAGSEWPERRELIATTTFGGDWVRVPAVAGLVCVRVPAVTGLVWVGVRAVAGLGCVRAPPPQAASTAATAIATAEATSADVLTRGFDIDW